jgi:RNA-binding protein 5/10
LIANRPIAISFADPASFKPASAGPLGGQFLLRASSNGGIGSETINEPDGRWCAYDSEQAGAAETIPERGQAISEDGQLPELPSVLRSLLGIYAGKDLSQVETATVPVPPTGGLINIASVMQPIKIGTSINFGGKGKKEDGFGFAAAGSSRKAQNLFGDEEESDLVGKDTVLLSRSKPFPSCPDSMLMYLAKGAHIVPPTSGSRKVKFGCIRLALDLECLLTLWLTDRQKHFQMEHETIGTCGSGACYENGHAQRGLVRQCSLGS